MTLTNKTRKAGRSKLAKARKQLTPAELFFFEHAGYSYDPKTETAEQGRIKGAKLLAKAEQHATDNLWECRWEIDNDIPYEDALGDHAYWCDDQKNGIEHEHEIWYCMLTDGKDNVLGSLGAIIDPSREYRRVVEAELALEAM